MKKSFAVLFALLLAGSAFGADWYICMGSFRDVDNALTKAEMLAENGFSAYVNECSKSDSEKLYRVLYSEKFSTKSEAKYRVREISTLSKVGQLNIGDMWACQSDGRKYEEPVIVEMPFGLEDDLEYPEELVREVVREVPVPADGPATPQKQTVVVKINGIEEQRFDITTADRLIRVNLSVPVPEDTHVEAEAAAGGER